MHFDLPGYDDLADLRKAYLEHKQSFWEWLIAPLGWFGKALIWISIMPWYWLLHVYLFEDGLSNIWIVPVLGIALLIARPLIAEHFLAGQETFHSLRERYTIAHYRHLQVVTDRKAELMSKTTNNFSGAQIVNSRLNIGDNNHIVDSNAQLAVSSEGATQQILGPVNLAQVRDLLRETINQAAITPNSEAVLARLRSLESLLAEPEKNRAGIVETANQIAETARTVVSLSEPIKSLVSLISRFFAA